MLQALLTPDLDDYNFPHYRFFETFFVHTMIVTTAMFMTFVERFRPTWRGLAWTMLITLLNLLARWAHGVATCRCAAPYSGGGGKR